MSVPVPHTVNAAALRPIRTAQARLAHPFAVLELTCAQADGIVRLLALDLAVFDARPLGALPDVAPDAAGEAAGGREPRAARHRWPARDGHAAGARPRASGERAAVRERAWRGDAAAGPARSSFTGPAGSDRARLAAHDRERPARRDTGDRPARAGGDRAAFGVPGGDGAAPDAHVFAAAHGIARPTEATTAARAAGDPDGPATLAEAADAAHAAGRPARRDTAGGSAAGLGPRAPAGRERVAAAIGAPDDRAVPERAVLAPPPAARLADLADAALARPAAPSAAPVPPSPAADLLGPRRLDPPAEPRANGLPAAPVPPAGLTPAEHAWLVNEALVEQARRHGVDLS